MGSDEKQKNHSVLAIEQTAKRERCGKSLVSIQEARGGPFDPRKRG
jgi:hypothetical protein